jgi:hypothetical protein
MALLRLLTIVFIFVVTLPFCKSSSKKDNNEIENETLKNVVSSSLQKRIISMIELQDSLANADKTHTRHTSFWTSLYKKDHQCYVAIISNFRFYSSKATNGYLKYKDKVITFYGEDTECGTGIINFDRLQTGRIKSLIDYDYVDWKETLPPPPPPPHEPFRREYLIVNKDSLQLVYEGY